ncbi:MAG: serine/threonine protein kinase with repeat [Deltaproteobacteria bacterium]|nr:serine/threonine protein kinase with repeat [Deltaproteobacteria bacterium]
MAVSPSPASDDEGVSIGSVLDGRYRIDGVLGSGGMGRVYRGEHTGIGRAVAIKVLHAAFNRNREAAARFQREALASGRLDHPNIVGVSDFGVLETGACYLVMEVLEGESLGDRLIRENRLPWRVALEILRGVLNGLQHAHERGVVHRDIKPDNVFLARKDHDEHVVKILDFGIAKLFAGNADDPASTRTGITVGTPAYLSPEQAVGGAITPASDLYSATIVLFEMLVGRAPFEDRDPLAMLGAHVSRTPPTVGELAPDLELPPGLEQMIQAGLVKTAADRIASAADYRSWIDTVIAHASAVGSVPIAMPGSIPTPMPHGPIVTAAPSLEIAVERARTTATDSSVDGPELARATRVGSLADGGDPIPRRWMTIGVLVVLVFMASALVLFARNDGSSPGKPGKPGKEPAASSTGRSQALTVPKPAPPDESTIDRQTQLKAALHDLSTGKDCAARRAAIPVLVELGDPAAIPALKSARYRMRGGVLGIGDDNTNGCLLKDADAAIKKLTPTK